MDAKTPTSEPTHNATRSAYHAPPPSLELQATSHDDALLMRWHAVISAAPEPLLVSRLLQKLICQGAELEELGYERGEEARVTLRFRLAKGRAYRLAQLWRALLHVKEVRLEEAEEMGGG